MKVRYTIEGRAEAKKEIEWWREQRRDCPERAFEEIREGANEESRTSRLVFRAVPGAARLELSIRA